MTKNKTPDPAMREGAFSTVGYHIARARVTTERLFSKHIGEPFLLKPVEFSLIALLSVEGSMTPKQLSRMLALSSSLLTLLLDRMQDREWILRVRSKIDGRSQQVSLSAAGRVLASKLQVTTPAMEAELKGVLSPAERGMLIELLAKVADVSFDKSPGLIPRHPTPFADLAVQGRSARD